MITAHRTEDVRAAEASLLRSTADGALMQRAAAGLAAACVRVLRRRRGHVSGARVVLLVGAGNNGGDALWAGERLRRRGCAVVAVMLARQVHQEGLTALVAAGGSAETGRTPDGAARAAAALSGADLVVDGLVGLGASGGLRDTAATLVQAIPRRAGVVAVDLPSGVDPDSGQTPAAHVRADVTVTFGTAKACLLVPPGSRAAGEVVVVDLGLAGLLPQPVVERLEPVDAGLAWVLPGAEDDKYSRGVVGVVAGSATYPGAAVLACAGALRAGAGMVRFCGPDDVVRHVRRAWPEVVVGPGRVQAWVLGCGVDPDAPDGQRELVEAALWSGLPCVVDAGALRICVQSLTGAGRPARAPVGPLLLTPHAGELAELLSGLDGERVERADVDARPLHHAARLARELSVTVLLKGSTTLVVPPSGTVRSQADAPAWLATAGAGDVLAGIAGTLLAAGHSPLDAGSLAAVVHGRAAVAAGFGWSGGGGRRRCGGARGRGRPAAHRRAGADRRAGRPPALRDCRGARR